MNAYEHAKELALKLSDQERESLWVALAESLNTVGEEDSRQCVGTGAESRVDALDAGKLKTSTFEEVQERIMNRPLPPHARHLH